MDGIKDFPFELRKPISMAFKLLICCNITYFNDNVSNFKKYWRFLYIIPVVLTHFFFETLYIKGIFKNNVTISKLSWNLPIYCVLIQGFMKAAIVYPMKAKIERIISDLPIIWRSNDKLTTNQVAIKESRLKKLNIYLTVFFWSSMLATCQGLITAMCNVLYKKYVLHQETELDLVFGDAYPPEVMQNWFLYLTVYLFQCFSMLQFIFIYLGSEYLMIVLCSILSIAFALIREDLSYVDINKNETNKNEDIASCSTDMTLTSFIQNHQKLIHLVELLNVVFNRLVCTDFVFATVIICFLGFGATVSQDTLEFMKHMTAVTALMMPIYILCYYAEQLQEESAGIMNSAYEMLWYKGSKYFQKSVCFIILRSQKPCCLTSLNYSPISLNSFTKVVSTTYSYFSLVRTMYAEKNT